MTYYIQTSKTSDLISVTTTTDGSIVFPWPYPEVTGPHDTPTTWPKMKPYLPDTNPWPSSPPQQGWECPRCHRINAPHVDQCTCVPPQTD